MFKPGRSICMILQVDLSIDCKPWQPIWHLTYVFNIASWVDEVKIHWFIWLINLAVLPVTSNVIKWVHYIGCKPILPLSIAHMYQGYIALLWDKMHMNLNSPAYMTLQLSMGPVVKAILLAFYEEQEHTRHTCFCLTQPTHVVVECYMALDTNCN